MFWGKSRFHKAVKRYGWERCSWCDDTLMVGLPPDPAYYCWTVITLPPKLERVAFLEAPLQVDLVDALARSPERLGIKRLSLATSHAYAEQKRGDYDFRAPIAALMGRDFPALERLELGEMEPLFNGHRYFGKVGDLTGLLDGMPRLEMLGVHGTMDLTKPWAHSALQDLFVELDDIGVNGGPMTQESVSNLVRSRLPALRSLELALEDGDPGLAYELPGRLDFPELRSISIEPLTAESKPIEEALRAEARRRMRDQ